MSEQLPVDGVDVLDDQAVLRFRGPRNMVDPYRPYAYHIEPERTAGGRIEDVATIFITNKECPFRCIMCDLWKNTTPDRVPEGAVATQVEWALQRLPYAPHVKLYNSGNFFDEQAISRHDRACIPALVNDRRTVIVECHPRLIDQRCVDFSRSLKPALQVAMGLETVDPHVLSALNKRMTLDDYERATHYLLNHEIQVRAFILLKTPYQSEQAGMDWAMRSIDFAFSIGVECCAVVPTRTGNGLMERLEQHGHFSPPTLRLMEAVLEYGISLSRGRVFMDLWDIEKFYDCSHCSHQRAQRMMKMNRTQIVLPMITCRCLEETCKI